MGRPRDWLIRFSGAALITALLAYVPYLVYRGDGFVKLRKMHEDLDDFQKKNDALRVQNQELRREIRHLRSDPAAITAVARDELGLVKPGEIVIQIEKP